MKQELTLDIIRELHALNLEQYRYEEILRRLEEGLLRDPSAIGVEVLVDWTDSDDAQPISKCSAEGACVWSEHLDFESMPGFAASEDPSEKSGTFVEVSASEIPWLRDLAPAFAGTGLVWSRRLYRQRIWICVAITETADIEEWKRAIATLVPTFAAGRDPKDSLASRTARTEFFDGFNDIVFRDVDSDSTTACRIWRTATTADLVILWRYIEHAEEYELCAKSAPDESLFSNDEIFKEHRTIKPPNGLGHYACRTKKTKLIEKDIESWRDEHDGVEYEFVLGPFLKERGITAVQYVPLLSSAQQAEGDLCDVISLYFHDAKTRKPHSNSSLLRMGRATAQLIDNSERAEKSRSQAYLANLTKTYLVPSDANSLDRKSPEKLQSEFFNELLQMIREEFNVAVASIFLKSRFSETLHCVATTGLVDATSGKLVPQGRIRGATYRAGEGRTGQCFVDGEASIQASKPRTHRGRYIEKRRDTANDPTLILAIPGSSGSVDSRNIGVVRCGEHGLFDEGGTRRHFTPSEIERLSSLLELASPMIEVLMERIAREEIISIIHHDIATPLSQIRDKSEQLCEDLEKGRAPSEHDYQDIRSCAYSAIDMADQLIAGAETRRKLFLESTKLLADIIMPLKNLLSRTAKESKSMKIIVHQDLPYPEAMKVDRYMIERVFNNILVNAIKYGRQNTAIDVRALPDQDGYARIAISNYGIGISREDGARVFTPYFRSENAMREARRGVGLGLSIARDFLEAHGGFLKLEKFKDPTTFVIGLPTKISPQESPKSEAS